jgi:hypothetical protein
MKAARLVLLAMAALGVGGCVALNRASIAPKARPVAERTFDLDGFVAEHNRNAESIESLEAKPTIGLRSKLRRGQGDGRLAMVRPRNFKLEIYSTVANRSLANIGSNDEEFWFSVQSSEDPSIYWCKYSELESSALSVAFQPDWIIEAIGLKPITPEEADGIRVERTDDPHASALLFPPTKSRGETYQRMMIVSNYTRRIKEHRLYEGTRPRQTLLAKAVVPSYKDYDLEKSESGAFRSCYLPQSVKLDWIKDQLSLDVVLPAEDVKVNQFDESRSAAVFVEPVIPGYERINLADMARAAPHENRTTARRTLPAPPSRSGVKLGPPGPVTDGPADAPHARASDTRNAGGRISSPLEDLVTAPLPIGAEGDSARQAAAALANAEPSPIGR